MASEKPKTRSIPLFFYAIFTIFTTSQIPIYINRKLSSIRYFPHCFIITFPILLFLFHKFQNYFLHFIDIIFHFNSLCFCPPFFDFTETVSFAKKNFVFMFYDAEKDSFVCSSALQTHTYFIDVFYILVYAPLIILQENALTQKKHWCNSPK